VRSYVLKSREDGNGCIALVIWGAYKSTFYLLRYRTNIRSSSYTWHCAQRLRSGLGLVKDFVNCSILCNRTLYTFHFLSRNATLCTMSSAIRSTVSPPPITECLHERALLTQRAPVPQPCKLKLYQKSVSSLPRRQIVPASTLVQSLIRLPSQCPMLSRHLNEAL